MKKLEECARALEPQAWAALGLCDTLAYANRRKSSLRKAAAVIRCLMEPEAFMVASALPHVGHPSDGDMRLGAAAFEILSPGNTNRVSEGVTAGAELARDFRAMLQSVLEEGK